MLHILALLTALARPAGDSTGVVWKPGFGTASLWNDGRAEVSVYDARDIKYGIPRSSRAVLIVVAEDLLGDRLVKADHPSSDRSLVRVLKVNHVRAIQTGVYSYQQMLSVFLAADSLDPVKLTMTSHEWCGNSFAEWRRDRASLELRTYFETPADVDVPLRPEGAVFYDALPLKLRGLDFDRTRRGRLGIIGSVFSNRPTPPAIEEAFLTVTPGAGPPPAYRVELTRGNRTDVFEFEAAAPHRLLSWKRSDGGSLRLRDSRRFRYWEKNGPGDERVLSSPGTR
jgi:hypothetical protein